MHRFSFLEGNKYDDHISSTAADALASAYSLNAANFTPFTLPYYNPGIFFNQNCQPVLPNLNGRRNFVRWVGKREFVRLNETKVYHSTFIFFQAIHFGIRSERRLRIICST